MNISSELWWNDCHRDNQSVRRKRPSQWHSVYDKSRINRDRARTSAITGRRLTSRAKAMLLKHEFIVTNTGCFRRNLRYYGRTFLRKVYIDITKHTYIRSWTVRVHTHQQSRVESNPVQSDSQRRGSDSCGLLTMAAAAVRTHQQSRVESHESCRVKSRDAACFICVSQILVIGRDGSKGSREVSSFSEGPGGNLRRLALWTPEPRLTLMMMFITNILMGDKCGLLVLPGTVPVEGVLSVHCPSALYSQKASQAIRTRVCEVMYLEPQDCFHEVSARFSYLTSLCQSDIN